MKLKKITFSNFKMFKNFEVDFSQKTNILGENAIGKSSIIDGFFWVFFGQSSTGIKAIDFPKPIVKGEIQHKLETSVTVTIDDTEYTKVLKENYVTRQGTDKEEFKNNTNDFYIDGVPCQKKEFEKEVETLFGSIENFRLFASPSAIPTMKWDKMRALLVGDSEALDALEKELKKQKAVRKKQVENIEQLPTRIDEASRLIEDVEFDEGERSSITASIDELKIKKNELQNPSESIVDKEILEVKDVISSAKMDIEDLKNSFLRDEYKIKDEINNKITSLRAGASEGYEKEYQEWNDAKGLMLGKESECSKLTEAYERDVDSLEAKILSLRDEFSSVSRHKWENNCNCKTCGQVLPLEKKEDFNLRRSNKIDEINETGKQNKEKLESIREKLEKKTIELNEVKQSILAHDAEKPVLNAVEPTEIRELKEKLENLPRLVIPEEMTLRLSGAESHLETLFKKKESEAPDFSKEIEDIDRKIGTLDSQLKSFDEARAQAAAQDGYKKRVLTLTEELKTQGELLQKTEKSIFQTEEAIKKEVASIENNLNGKFEITKFKLFYQQLNDGIKPICIPMVDGVDYERLNTAMKIDCGIDIINTLSKERALDFPVFIDNAECSNNILKPNSQSMFLYVTKDKKIKVQGE